MRFNEDIYMYIWKSLDYNMKLYFNNYIHLYVIIIYHY